MSDGVRVGIAHSDYAAQLIRSGAAEIDYVEIPVERLVHDPSTLSSLGGLPCVLHCSSLSIAGTIAPDEQTVEQVARWAGETATPWIGEHLAFVTAGDGDGVYDVGFTVSPVMDEDTLCRVLAAVERWEARFGRPILLENSPMYFELPDSTMSQAAFFHRVCEASRAGVLLDLTHFLATARNFALDPIATLDAFPLERVVEIHISGLSLQSGVWWDDHASAAPDEVFALLDRVVPRSRALEAVTLEYNWDPAFPASTIAAHVARIREAGRHGRSSLRGGMSLTPHSCRSLGQPAQPAVPATHASVARILDGLPADGAALPRPALEMFRGFLTKVRHNAVRAEMPRTMTLLQRAGREIDFFREYADEFASLRASGAAKEERIAALAAAIARFSAGCEELRHVSAVARHEMLVSCGQPRGDGATRGRRLLLAAHVERYDLDPRRDEPTAETTFLAYPGAIELPVAAVLLLSLLDGSAAIARAVRRAAEQTAGDPGAIRAFYLEAIDTGLAVLV